MPSTSSTPSAPSTPMTPSTPSTPGPAGASRPVGRRAVLGGALAAGAAATFVPSAARAAVPVRRLDRRVVVVGSGFGGAVTALRLTEAGVPVTLLEQGRRWPTGPGATTFPTVSELDERALFYSSAPQLFGRPVSPAPYAGLFSATVSPTMTVMAGNGYGGGSLTYQGMSLEPSAAVFAREFPAAIDRDEMHRVFYPRVARMLGLATAPDELVDDPAYATSRIFKRRVERAGWPVQKIPMPIDWSYALRELAGEMPPSYTNGDCAFGVNNGGKHSLDVTYLARAEATGRLETRLLHRVDEVERTADGRWRLTVVRTDVRGTPLETLVLTTGALVLAAGSAATTRMLVRAAALGHVPDLPDAVGGNWGTNADRIYTWTALDEQFPRVQGGPVVFGSLDWDDPARANTVIQASIPPVVLAGVLEPRLNTTILVGYGVSEARGRWAYDALRDDATLRWRHEADRVIQTEKIGPRVRAVAGAASLLLDTNAVVPSTWHPMGGVSMPSPTGPGAAPLPAGVDADGACDTEGRVRGQRGLYVLDGALLPGSAGACNPSMTIAAVAERALDRIVRRDVGTLI